MKTLVLQTSRHFVLACGLFISALAVCATLFILINLCTTAHTKLITLSNPVVTQVNPEYDAVLTSMKPVVSSSVEKKAYAARVGLPSRLAANNPQWKTVRMRVTAYCPCQLCCGKYADGVTANGHVIESGDCFAAADSQYPFGTELVVPGYNGGNPVKVIDRGSAIYDNRVDVFFPSHAQALKWGVRYLDVKVKVAAAMASGLAKAPTSAPVE
jgi:3D (Asp-Asp-Asp) domain-containing protein